MKKFADEGGWLRVCVCCAALLVHHGLRDSLITALPVIAALPPSSPASSTTIDLADTTVATSLSTHTYHRSTSPLTPRIFTTIAPIIPRISSQEFASSVNESINPIRDSLVGDKILELRRRESSSPQASPTSHHQEILHVIPRKIRRNDLLVQEDHIKSARRKDSRVIRETDLSGVDDEDQQQLAGYALTQRTLLSNSTQNEEWARHFPLGVGAVKLSLDFLKPPSHWQDQDLTDLKEEWSLLLEGVVLSAVYWTWLLTALLAHQLIHRVDPAVVLAGSVGVAGVLGLLTHAASLGGPWLLLASRLLLGAVQGVSFPCVARVLEGTPYKHRPVAPYIVFAGPYLGTILGGGLGGLRQWYIATYLVGGLALPVTLLCLMLPRHHHAPHKEVSWGQVLRSRAVWACAGVHMSHTWMVHTLLVGGPFCLVYVIGSPSLRGWHLALATTSALGISVSLCHLVHVALKGTSLTALNRRRFPVITGCVIVTVGTIVMATVGMYSTQGLMITVACTAFGLSVARAGYTLNMDDMAPWQVWRLNKVFDVLGVLVAAISPLVVTALAQGVKDGWVGVWLVPLAGVAPAAVLYLFMLTTNPLPWDEPADCAPAGANGEVKLGGEAGGNLANGGGDIRHSMRSKQSFKSARSGNTYKSARSANTYKSARSANTYKSARSVNTFKSARSLDTFKTAASRTRSRTLSCRTVDDDLEADMRSVAEDPSVDCHHLEDKEPDCYSVASTSTFKSDDMQSVIDGRDTVTQQHQGQQFGSMLSNGALADKTAVWLSSHHDLAITGTHCVQTPPTKEEIHSRNSIYGLFW
ncbi:uncharacterized protein [Procambarus clarkii]|uniref:uncharacterized protein isoform X1 n=1 Tax=Procambarus clarkii TaxID=6728 RepID=UPI003742A8FC